MIRKFAATKQPEAAEQSAVAAVAAAAGSREPPVDQRQLGVVQGTASTLPASEMKGRGSYEGCSLAEVMAEKRRATAALINGDLDQQLRLAASQGDSGHVHDLIEQGARLLPDKKGRTALHYAALSGYAEVVRLLLDSGICNVDAVDASGYSALHKAAGNGHLDIIELLIENGKAEVDLQDASNGNTALHEAAWNGYCKTVQLLLANNSNAYAANKAGCTALHLAAQNGHNQTTRTLLHAGCSPDVKNNYGDTPLHTATRYGHAGVTRILIRGKCVISEQNNNGDTSLHIAAAFRRRKIARLLMEGGIDWQLRNKQGETAIDTACRKENHEILDIIKSSVPRVASIQKPMQHAEFEYDDIMADSSETNEASLDPKGTPPPAPSSGTSQTKAKTGLIAWLKDRLNKDKQKLQQREAGSGSGSTTVTATAANWKDPKQRMQRMRSSGSAGSGSSQSGLFSQYVKQPGMAYYRDLAGNVRQGPAGYVPLYRGAGAGGSAGAHHHVSLPAMGSSGAGLQHSSPYAPTQQPALLGEPHTTWRHEHDNGAEVPEQPIYAEVLHFGLRPQAAHTGSSPGGLAPSRGFAGTQQHPSAGAVPAASEQQCRDDPFAYTSGVVQHFADDYRQEQYGRYEVSARFPGRQPVLFRSRSDETLSHSEYSYHGRAFRSREAAANELRALQEREKLKETRRHRRHAAAAAEPASRMPRGGGGGTAAKAVTCHESTLQLEHAFDSTGGSGAGQQQQQWQPNPAPLRLPTSPPLPAPRRGEPQPWRRSVEDLLDGGRETPDRGGGGAGRPRQRSRRHRRHRSADPNEDGSSSSCTQEAPCNQGSGGTLPRGGAGKRSLAAAAGAGDRLPAPPLPAGLHGWQRPSHDAAAESSLANGKALHLYEPRAMAASAVGMPSRTLPHPNEYMNLAPPEQQPPQQRRAAPASGVPLPMAQRGGAKAAVGSGSSHQAAGSSPVTASGGGGGGSSSSNTPRGQLPGRPSAVAVANGSGGRGSGLINGRAERTSPVRPGAAAGGGGGVTGGRSLLQPSAELLTERHQAAAAADLYGERRHAVLAELVSRSAEPPPPPQRALEAATAASGSRLAARQSTGATPTAAGPYRNFGGGASGTVGRIGMVHSSDTAPKLLQQQQHQQQSATVGRAARQSRPDSAGAAAGQDATALRRGLADAGVTESLSRSSAALSSTNASPYRDYRGPDVVVSVPAGTAAATPCEACLPLAAVSSSGLTSPRVDGSVGSNPDSGYSGSKAGEHLCDAPSACSAAVVVDFRSTLLEQPLPQDRKPLATTTTTAGSGRREQPPSYESWYSQRMSETHKQQPQQQQQSAAAVAPAKGQRRVISTFTTDV